MYEKAKKALTLLLLAILSLDAGLLAYGLWLWIEQLRDAIEKVDMYLT